MNEDWILANLRSGLSPSSSAQDSQVLVPDNSEPAPATHEEPGK